MDRSLTDLLDEAKEMGFDLRAIDGAMTIMGIYRLWFLANRIPFTAADLVAAAALDLDNPKFIATDMVKHANER